MRSVGGKSTQIVMVSTAYGLATVVAALDSGTLARAERRILVISTNTAIPEASTDLTEVAGMTALCARFDAVHRYNAAIEPLHPAGWDPRGEELPLLERYLRELWALGPDPVSLVVESIAVNPALALCRIFADAQIEVYGDGLMSYGPTRNALPDTVGVRIERLAHLDLVPGLSPVLLSEWHVQPVLIPSPAFRAVVASTSAHGDRSVRRERAPSGPVALVLGQYLSAGGLLCDAEEVELYDEMIAGAAAHHYPVVFKPHPSAPSAHRTRLEQAVRERGGQVSFDDGLELAEAWFDRGEVALVVGCFSTGLLTARSVYGLPAVCHGTDIVLAQLTPYQNSNRIPATIVDATVPTLRALPGGRTPPALRAGPAAPEVPAGTGTDPPAAAVAPGGPEVVTIDAPSPTSAVPGLGALVVAVSYAMQARLLARRRAEAVAFLQDNYAEHARYFKRRRLTSLELPGALPARTPPGHPPPDVASDGAPRQYPAAVLPAGTVRTEPGAAPVDMVGASAVTRHQRAVVVAARLRRRLRVDR